MAERTPLGKRTNSSLQSFRRSLTNTAKKNVSFAVNEKENGQIGKQTTTSTTSSILSTNDVVVVPLTPNTMLKSEMMKSADESLLCSPLLSARRAAKQQRYKQRSSPKTAPVDSRTVTSKPVSPIQPRSTVISKTLITRENYSSAIPCTPRGTGVCMDLSDMFRSVASSSKPPLSSSRKVLDTPSTKAPVQEEEWTEKQCETFASWLNYTLQPPDLDHHDDSAAHRALLVHQRMARARYQATQLYNSHQVFNVRQILQSEIRRGRLSIRQDRNVRADLTLRNHLLDLVLSYDTPWLRLGLETIFRTQIVPEPPKTASQQNTNKLPMSRMKLTIRNFIIHRVLADDVILAKYTKGKCKLPSGKFEIQYEAEMRAVILYRLLLLFFFLDQAKQASILDRTLFTGSAVKSSQDVLLAFCRHFLSGEGNFIKHLARVGLKVYYIQNPMDELDFSVSNLAVDLRDGVRLARLTEILTEAPRNSLLKQLRLPAVSRLQKLHNVGLVLKSLRTFGVPLSVELASHHIVDGHRDMVLKLMWTVVAHCCLNKLVDMKVVQAEIRRIEQAHKLSTSTWLDSDDGTIHSLKSILLQWCHTVCSCFRLSIRNLTDDFADGKALCLLIHYYHPNLLHIGEIKKTTRDLSSSSTSFIKLDTALASERFNSALANVRLSELGGIPKMVPTTDSTCSPDEKSMLLCLTFMCARLLESKGEVRAAVLVQRRYRAYRSVIVRERKLAAASFLLHVWREKRELYFEVQRCRYGYAVDVIERFVLSHRHDLKRLERNRVGRERIRRAAVVLQSFGRVVIARRLIETMKEASSAAIVCQALWRGLVARRLYLDLTRQRSSAIVLQRRWKAFRLQSLLKQRAATAIQRIWRGFWALLQFEIDVMDIVCVQSCARRYLATNERKRRTAAAMVIHCAAKLYLRQRQFETGSRRIQAAVVCQAFARCILATKKVALFRLHVHSALLLQAQWRCYKEQTKFAMLLRTCRVLQGHFRSCRERQRYLKMKQCAISIQQEWRSANSREILQRTRQGVILIQKCLRRFLAKTEMTRRRVVRIAATAIQSLWRGHSNRQRYSRAVDASCRIQSFLRAVKARTYVRNAVRSAHIIQASWRRAKVRRKFEALLATVIVCQKYARRYLAQNVASQRKVALATLQCAARQTLARRYLSSLRSERHLKLNAATTIQLIYRGHLVRRELYNLRVSATEIQRVFRGFSAWICYRMDLVDIILVQSLARRLAARRETSKRQDAVVLLQSMVRASLYRQYAIQALVEKRRAVQEVNAAVYIQRVFRGYATRCFTMKALAARRIQKTWRCYTVHVDYLLTLLATIEIQAGIRTCIAKKHAARRRESCLTIQSFGRRFLADLHIRKIRRSVVQIQSVARLYSVRADLRLRRIGAITIQRYTRGFLVRVERTIEEYSAREIQRIWRGHFAFAEYVWAVVSAIRIQTAMRSFISKRALENMRTELQVFLILRRTSAFRIQRLYRGYRIKQRLDKSARTLQCAARIFLSRQAFSKFRRGMISVQSLARGQRARHQRGKKMAALARRLNEATLRAEREPLLRLGNRTSAALVTLQTSTRLAEILAAICTLETATRLSEVCCRAFSQAGAADILFQLVRTCNRSLPHVELLYHILLTMHNVAQYDYLLPSLATRSGVEVFLDLVQMFRDKDDVFFLAATLLERVVRSNDDLMDLSSTKENMKRLNGVYALCMRKLSVNGNGRLSMSRESLHQRHLSGKKITRLQEGNELREGLRALKRVIRLCGYPNL